MSRVLPTSGDISANIINTAMSVPPGNKASTDQVSLNDSGTGVSVRMMFNKTSAGAQISFSDGYGKAYCTLYVLDQPDCHIYTGNSTDGTYGATFCDGGFGTVDWDDLENYCLSLDPGGSSTKGNRCGAAKFDIVFCDGSVVNDKIVSSLEEPCLRANPDALPAGSGYGLGLWSGGTTTQCFSTGT